LYAFEESRVVRLAQPQRCVGITRLRRSFIEKPGGGNIARTEQRISTIEERKLGGSTVFLELRLLLTGPNLGSLKLLGGLAEL
jgi:hypothetical protein